MYSPSKQECNLKDFNCLGDFLVSNLLSESMYISYINKVNGITEPTTQHTEWKLDYERNGVTVFKDPKRPAHMHGFASQGIVNAPYTTISEFVKDPQSVFVWDNFLVEAKYLKAYTHTSTCQDYLDMLYFVRCQYIKGKFAMAGISIEDDDYPPCASIPRCEMHRGSGFVIEPAGICCTSSASRVTYLANGNLKGVPYFIAAKVLQRHSMAIRYIRRSLELQESHIPSKVSTVHQDSSVPEYEEGLQLDMFMGSSQDGSTK